MKLTKQQQRLLFDSLENLRQCIIALADKVDTQELWRTYYDQEEQIYTMLGVMRIKGL